MGGGVLGIAYAGTIEVLEKKNVLQNVLNTAGTSVGAIAAALVSLKYTSSEIKEILYQTDFKAFHDGLNPLNLTSKYGIYKGDALLHWIEKFIAVKTGNPQATFNDLAEQGFLDLKVYATDLSVPELTEFSVENTPNVVVAEGLRSSVAIPLYFNAWKFRKNNPNNHIYVDGGVMYNFPISAYTDIENTLGIYLDMNEKAKQLDYNDVSLYIRQLFQAVLKGQNVDFFRFHDKEASIINIDSLGISFTKFDLTKTEKKKLFEQGKKAALNFINVK